MNLVFYISRLSENARTIESLVCNLSDEQARWKISSDKWSILQIVFHLQQTESKDFRPRLEKTLRDPFEEWSPLLPEEMQLKQETAADDFKIFLQGFLQERENSTGWLKTLDNPNFENTYPRQNLNLCAGDLHASWLAHDFLHIKQIIRAHFDYVNQISQPYTTDYAGSWT